MPFTALLIFQEKLRQWQLWWRQYLWRCTSAFKLLFFTYFLSPYLLRFWALQDRYRFLKLVEQGYCFELQFLGISTNKWWQQWRLHYHSNKSSDDVSGDHDSTATAASNGKKFNRSEELLEEIKEKETAWLRVCLRDCLKTGNEERLGDRNPKICLQSVFVHAQLYCWPEFYDNPYLKQNVSWQFCQWKWCRVDIIFMYPHVIDYANIKHVIPKQRIIQLLKYWHVMQFETL